MENVQNRGSNYQRQYAQIQQITFCSKQRKCHPCKHLYIKFWTYIIALLIRRQHCWTTLPWITSLHRLIARCYMHSWVGDWTDSILLRMFDRKEFDRLKVSGSYGWSMVESLYVDCDGVLLMGVERCGLGCLICCLIRWLVRTGWKTYRRIEINILYEGRCKQCLFGLQVWLWTTKRL